MPRHERTNLGAGRGVAVREFAMAAGHGDADYLVARRADGTGAVDNDRRRRCAVVALAALTLAGGVMHVAVIRHHADYLAITIGFA